MKNLSLLFALVLNIYALDDLTVPYSFSQNTPARASEVYANDTMPINGINRLNDSLDEKFVRFTDSDSSLAFDSLDLNRADIDTLNTDTINCSGDMEIDDIIADDISADSLTLSLGAQILGKLQIGQRDTIVYHLQIRDTTTGGSVFAQFTNDATGYTSADGFTIGLNSDEAAYLYNNENTAIKFFTNALEALSINNDQTITTTGSITTTDLIANGNIQINDDAYIGIDSDTDLLQLTSGQLVLNGSLQADFILLDDSSNIGIVSDNNLLQLQSTILNVNGQIISTGSVTTTDLIANGNIQINDSAYIGIDSDIDLMELYSDSLVLNGDLTLIDTLSIGGIKNNLFVQDTVECDYVATNGAAFQYSSGSAICTLTMENSTLAAGVDTIGTVTWERIGNIVSVRFDDFSFRTTVSSDYGGVRVLNFPTALIPDGVSQDPTYVPIGMYNYDGSNEHPWTLEFYTAQTVMIASFTSAVGNFASNLHATYLYH